MKPSIVGNRWISARVFMAVLFALAYGTVYHLAYLPQAVAYVYAPVWPAIGIVLAALLLSPRSQWPVFLCLSFGIGFTYHALGSVSPWPLMLAVAVINAAQTWLAAWLILRLCRGPFDSGRLRDVLVLIVVAAGTSAAGAVLLAIVRANHSPIAVGSGNLIFARWSAHCLAAVIVTPLITAWAAPRGRRDEGGFSRLIEAVVLFGGSAVFLHYAGGPGTGSESWLPGKYGVLVPVIIAAIRFGPRGAVTMTALVAFYVTGAAATGVAGLAAEESVSREAKAFLLLGITAATGLLLAASQAEKDDAIQAARKSEAKVRMIFEQSINAIALVRHGLLLLVNPAFARLVGGDLQGRLLAEMVQPDDAPVLQRALAGEGRAPRPSGAVELRGRRADGTEFPLEIRFGAFDFDGGECLLLSCRDLTAQKQAEGEIRQAQRAQRALGRCNQVLVHAQEEETLLRDVCRVIVAEAGYRMVWVGYAQPDEDKSVRPVAHAGSESDYVMNLKISWADVPRGRGPTGLAIRTGEPVVCRNFAADPRLAPWREDALRHGIQSSLVFPLRVDGVVIGALSIYSDRTDVFDQGETALLAEFAADLGYGIQALRARVHREQAQTEVRQLLAEAEQGRATLLSIMEDQQLAVAERELSEERYRTAMLNSAIGMALVAPDGCWIETNPALCQIVGYSRDELLMLDFQSITHPDDLPEDLRQRAAMLAGTQGNYEREKRYRHKSGRLLWVQVNVSLLRDAGGRPLHFVTQVQDVTARREAEISLEAAAERLALALRVSRFGIWRHNLQTGVSEWDERMFAIFGLPVAAQPPDLETILALVVEEDRPPVRRSWRALPTCNHSYHMRFRVLRPDGALRHVELQGVVHDDPIGRAEWSIGVAGDYTDIVQATAESEQLRAQLQQSQKMEALGTLAAGVAHDFNNLLTGINGFVELASTSLAPGHEAGALLQQARRGAMSARDLVRRILNFSRTKVDRARARIDLASVVRDTAPLIAAALPGNVSLSVTVDCAEAPVMADGGQMQQILMNLCTNGAHAIGTRAGKIQIRVQLCELGSASFPAPAGCSLGRHVRLSVTDTGSGMDEATRRRIFEPFFTTKQPGEGTGLGLSIVQDIVKAHEGGLGVESTPGVGTTFAIYLPFAQSEGDVRPVPVPPAITRGAGQRILIVDDEPSVGMVVRLTLQKSGYEPESYASPAAAWQRFEADPGSFSLLIVDQNMPEIGGVEFVGRARALRPELPVILMSGRFENTHGAAVLDVARLRKPFEIVELIGAVKTALVPPDQSPG